MTLHFLSLSENSCHAVRATFLKIDFVGFCALILPPSVSPETGAGYAFILFYFLYYTKYIMLFLVLDSYHGQSLYDSIPRPKQSTNNGTKPREPIMSFKKKEWIIDLFAYRFCSLQVS